MDLEERRALIANFLRKCVTYSNDSISRKIAGKKTNPRYQMGDIQRFY